MLMSLVVSAFLKLEPLFDHRNYILLFCCSLKIVCLKTASLEYLTVKKPELNRNLQKNQ